jgi:hypothetical protein
VVVPVIFSVPDNDVDPLTDKPVNVPRDVKFGAEVILDCVAVVTVPAVVADAAEPVMLIPHVPLAPDPVNEGEYDV